jgi:hypothetical protein
MGLKLLTAILRRQSTVFQPYLRIGPGQFPEFKVYGLKEIVF